MARSFTSKDAKRLIHQHEDIMDKLSQIQERQNFCISKVKESADAFVAAEVMEALKEVPIEEVSRAKRGIRVKALRDHGYRTIADIATASVHQISSVYGIGEETAHVIHRKVREIVDQTRKNTKIRISMDRKTKSASELVINISSLIQAVPLSQNCLQLKNDYFERVENAIDDLGPGTSGLRWFFSFRRTKEKGENAYKYLSELLEGSFGAAVNEVIQKAENADHMTEPDAWQDFQRNSVRFFSVLEAVAPGVLGTDDAMYGLPEDLAREVQDEAFFPEGLLCELRRYQEWGVKYILHQERVLLGDEMGLGKTIQAIATMVSLKNTGASHFVVVCPASVITNWCREIASKSKLRVTKVHGNGRKQALNAWIRTGGVAVTTYETTGYFKTDESFTFSLLVVDEAHYIKNSEARRSINVKNIAKKAERILFMTGTALENKVSEMVALIEILQPEIAHKVSGMEFLAAAPQFRKMVAPVYYRRKREDVLTELPELIENKEWCTLLPEEEHVYEQAVLQKNYAESRRVSWNIDDLHDSSKARRLLELIEEAESEGRKIIVFSFFLDTLRKIVDFLGDRCLSPINGSVPPARRQEIIDKFDKSPAGTVLAAQIQSGGTGLNIQSASVVIMCEPQFKPSIENQAISRAYRMGQTRNVLVYRLLCENTVDEKILSLLEEKQAIFDAFADKSEAAGQSVELDEKGFGDIIREEIERIKAKSA